MTTDLLLVSSGDWDSPFRVNCHEIAVRWGARGKVTYLEPAPLRKPRLSDRNRLIRRVKQAFLPGAGESRADVPAVTVVRPRYLPWHPVRGVLAWNLRTAEAALRSSAMALGRPLSFDVIWYFSPALAGLDRVVASRLVIYHAVDDYSANPGVNPQIVAKREQEILRRAHLVFATSEPLAERLRRQHGAVMVWENVTDPEALVDDEPPPARPLGQRPKAAYVGNLSDHKVDFPLLLDVARRMRGWDFVLAGAPHSMGSAGRQLLSEPNVRHLGAVPRTSLPAVFRDADAALLPLPKTQLHEYSFPIKLLDYLALRLPVVGRRTAPTARFHDFILPADNAAEYESQLSVAEARRHDAGYRARCVQAARANSWQVRMDQLEAAIRTRL